MHKKTEKGKRIKKGSDNEIPLAKLSPLVDFVDAILFAGFTFY